MTAAAELVATLPNGGYLIIRDAPVGQPCAACEREADVELDVDDVVTLPGDWPIPVCGGCVAAALAVRLAANHVRAGGNLADVTDQLPPGGA